MKLSAVTVLLAISGASAYSTPSRASLRSLGQKSVSLSSGPRKTSASMKMEDFGVLGGSGIGFDDLWGADECISEVGLENRLNSEGLRFKMNRTPEEADEVGPLWNLPGFNVNLPLIGETYLGPPKVASIWEGLGFTATSNNEARQKVKLEAIEAARTSKKGPGGSIWPVPKVEGGGVEVRSQWLEKYGYPRLVGSGGIFYADQLSTDKQPMGGFNMGKSGSIWPVPEIVEAGQYGGEKGWGMKKNGRAVDDLPPNTKF